MDGHDYVVIANFGEELSPVEVASSASSLDLISGQPVQSTLQLAAGSSGVWRLGKSV
jgi:hypothetical protein